MQSNKEIESIITTRAQQEIRFQSVKVSFACTYMCKVHSHFAPLSNLSLFNFVAISSSNNFISTKRMSQFWTWSREFSTRTREKKETSSGYISLYMSSWIVLSSLGSRLRSLRCLFSSFFAYCRFVKLFDIVVIICLSFAWGDGEHFAPSLTRRNSKRKRKFQPKLRALVREYTSTKRIRIKLITGLDALVLLPLEISSSN